MAKITLIEGHVDIKKLLPRYKIIDKKSEMAFLVSGDDCPRVVNSAIIGDNEFLKWVCINSRYDTYIIFSKKIPAGFSKTGLKLKTNEIQTLKGEMPDKEDLFKLMDAIAFSKDRAAVYDMLSKSNSQYAIMLFFMSNANALGEYNTSILKTIDMYALAKNTRLTNELLAFSIKPISGRIFWKYLFPKKADKEEDDA